MAKARSRSTHMSSQRGWWMMLAIVALLGGLGWYFHTPAQAYAQAATAYTARVACSCRYVAGRSLEDCEKDKLEGTEFVTLVEDPATQTITARFPLIAVDRASYRKGYGCVLQEWQG